MYGHEVKMTAGRSLEWLDRKRIDYLNAIIDCQYARFLNTTLLGADLLTPSKIPLDDNLRYEYRDAAAAAILD